MNTCKTCKWWGAQPPKGQWMNIDGLCGRIYEGSMANGIKAETFNHWGDDSGLTTAPDFGCVLHEEKP